MKRVAFIVLIATVGTFTSSQEIPSQHPNLPTPIRAFVDGLEEDSACDLPADMTVQVEALLSVWG